MAAGDVYGALQRGPIDGGIGSSGISDFRYDEGLAHLTLGIPLGWQGDFVVATNATSAKLPQVGRDALTAAAARPPRGPCWGCRGR